MWAQLLSTGIGVWLMVAPDVVGYVGAASTVDRVVGPLVFTFALTAAWEATRAARWVNIVLSAWLLIAPLLLDYTRASTINSVVTGLALFALSFVKGRTRHSFAGGWRSLVRPTTTG